MFTESLSELISEMINVKVMLTIHLASTSLEFSTVDSIGKDNHINSTLHDGYARHGMAVEKLPLQKRWSES